MWQDDYRILNNIEDPKDIKRLSIEELEILAKEIRDKIVKTVSKNGGHLAPNLGAVELTLALHYVFDAPRDKIIWDVGHQSYAHKLITGRRTRFHTLRTYKGISGFPKRSESPYDTFDTGHSSTSISVGLGISSAKSLKGEKAHVVAVIGDGAMTAGMAFEALNQTGHMEKDLIVVLNDNAMSIAPNVGSFSSFISRKMTGKRFVYLRKELRNFLKSIPGVGENIINLIRKSEDSLITFFTPGMLFEAFKFKYVGPINGHRLELLIETFNNVKHLEGPVLVHVTTQKGKGYGPAEENPTLFHGIGPFDIKTGRPIKKRDSPPSYTEIFGKTLVELAEQDKRIVAITAAMPEGAGLHLFRDRFPERFFDVGIAEQHAVTFAAGLATEGLRPVVAIYSTFLQRAYDQIIHDVCLSNLPVVFCLDRSGLVGEDGPTHHGQFDLTYFRNLPRMVVMAPKDEDELRHMLYTALRYKGGPIAIRYPRGEAVGVEMASEFRELPIGKGEILTQGKDLLILAVGSMVQPSIRAHESLNRDGIEVTLLNCRFIKPLDPQIGELCQKIGKALVVEENIRHGGLGGAVLEYLSDRGIYGIKIKRLGLPDDFVEHGPLSVLRESCGLNEEGIYKAAKELYEI